MAFKNMGQNMFHAIVRFTRLSNKWFADLL